MERPFALRMRVRAAFLTLGFLCSLLSFSAHSHAPLKEDISTKTFNSFIKRFHQSPAQVINETPTKWYRNSKGQHTHPVKTPKTEAERRAFFQRKAENRHHLLGIHGKHADAKAAYQGNDDPAKLVDEPQKMEVMIQEIHKKYPQSFELKTIPWPDDYWPTRQGQLGKRYMDPNFPDKKEPFLTHHSYYRRNPAYRYFVGEDEDGDPLINQLSPSEKYDLITGGKFIWPLTQAMWKEGLDHQRSSGKVEAWMGLCHGWAPASLMLPRPKSSLKLKSLDGKRDITFYPADIKALGTLLWSNSDFDMRYIGGRCNTFKPATEYSTGRILDQNCFDTNPASFHMALMHQLGGIGRGFIIDATFDYEVWNQPVVGYKVRFFNPQSMYIVETTKEATIRSEYSQFPRDPFRRHRSPKAKYIMGVVLDLDYVEEFFPNPDEYDNDPSESIVTVQYVYDLEIDEDGRIIGGEWYQNKHPDFLWIPEKDATISTPGDSRMEGTWDPLKAPMPSEWANIARRSASSALVHTPIVKAIFEASFKRGAE